MDAPFRRGSIRKQSRKNLTAKRHLPRYRGTAFHQGVLCPAALHLPLCSDCAVLRGSCGTFVFLCHARFAGAFCFVRKYAILLDRKEGKLLCKLCQRPRRLCARRCFPTATSSACSGRSSSSRRS